MNDWPWVSGKCMFLSYSVHRSLCSSRPNKILTSESKDYASSHKNWQTNLNIKLRRVGKSKPVHRCCNSSFRNVAVAARVVCIRDVSVSVWEYSTLIYFLCSFVVNGGGNKCVFWEVEIWMEWKWFHVFCLKGRPKAFFIFEGHFSIF